MSGVRREAPHASSIVVRAGPEALSRVADWIRARGDAHALAPALLDRIDVCAAELVANVLEHGLGGAAGAPVRVALIVGEARVQLVIDDEAPAFDPLRRAPRASARMDESRVGGWGIAIVRHFAHELDYARTPNGNRLTATFLLDAGTARAAPR